jgi:hypothetical protein
MESGIQMTRKKLEDSNELDTLINISNKSSESFDSSIEEEEQEKKSTIVNSLVQIASFPKL